VDCERQSGASALLLRGSRPPAFYGAKAGFARRLRLAAAILQLVRHPIPIRAITTVGREIPPVFSYLKAPGALRAWHPPAAIARAYDEF
jgi:hypothetical protein